MLYLCSILWACQVPAPTITEAVFPSNTRDPYGPFFVNAKVEGSVNAVYLWVEGMSVETSKQAVYFADYLINDVVPIDAGMRDMGVIDQGIMLSSSQKRKIAMRKMGNLWLGEFEGLPRQIEYRLQIEAVGEGGSSFYPSTPQSFTVTLASLNCLVDQDCLSFEICDRNEYICKKKTQSCGQDADCPIDQRCDGSSKICVFRDDLCTIDTDCSTGYRCDENRLCVSICDPPCDLSQKCITIPADLSNDLIEDDMPKNQCIDQNQSWCTSNIMCNIAQNCNLQTGQCEQIKCLSTDDCIAVIGSEFECVAGLCSEVPYEPLYLTFENYCLPCSSASDCGTTALGCSSNGYCRKSCSNEDDCNAGEALFGRFYCDYNSNTCVEAYPIYPEICSHTNSCQVMSDCLAPSICVAGKCIESNYCIQDTECSGRNYCVYNTCVPSGYCDLYSVGCPPEQECVQNQCQLIDYQKSSCNDTCNSSFDCQPNEVCSYAQSNDPNQKYCLALCDPNVAICGNGQYCGSPVSGFNICMSPTGTCDFTNEMCPFDLTEPNDNGYLIDIQINLNVSLNGSLCPSTDVENFNILRSERTWIELYVDQPVNLYIEYTDRTTGAYSVISQIVGVDAGFSMILDMVSVINISNYDPSLINVNYTLNLSEQPIVANCVEDSLEPNNSYDNPSVFGNGAYLSLVACQGDLDYLRLSRRIRGDGFVELQNVSLNGVLYVELYLNGNLYQTFDLVDFLSIPISGGRMDEWMFVIQNNDVGEGISYVLNSRF